MTPQDVVTGLFNLSAGLLLFRNCRLLFKAKEVKGVSILTTAVFSVWGFWNLYYYPHLEQAISFIGCILVVIANSLWVGMAIYYTRRKKHGA